MGFIVQCIRATRQGPGESTDGVKAPPPRKRLYMWPHGSGDVGNGN